jgi:hypothetical protein
VVPSGAFEVNAGKSRGPLQIPVYCSPDSLSTMGHNSARLAQDDK